VAGTPDDRHGDPGRRGDPDHHYRDSVADHRGYGAAPRAVGVAPSSTLRLTGARCRCAACRDFFNSTSSFDRHRVGNWTERGSHRRCLSAQEMIERGWKRNTAGFWIERQRSLPSLDGARESGDRVRPSAEGHSRQMQEPGRHVGQQTS
jgi:hypothetical protein